MGILEIIGNALKLLALIFGKIFERNAEKKKEKAEAGKMVKEGISSRDRSKVTAGFTRFKNI